MRTLSDKKWLPISIVDIFELLRGREGNMAMLDEGEIPLISAKNGNNGLKGFVGAPKSIVPGNCISLNNDGDGGAGLAYYQPSDMALDTHVTALIPKDSEQSKEAMQFIAECTSGLHDFFGHGLSISNKRVSKIKIMLPTGVDGNPDYEFMEQYVKKTREGLLARYNVYVDKQLLELEYYEIPSLGEKKWENFLVPNVFNHIQRGKRLKKADHVPGMVPYVSSRANNNGVDDYIEAAEGTRIFSDCISLANSGSVGKAFYEPFSFVASDHVTSLKLNDASKWVYLFLIAVIEKQSSNYNFNREINDARINKMQIMLPVNEKSEPDFEYMEQYIKNVMFKKYQQYLAFYKNKKEDISRNK